MNFRHRTRACLIATLLGFASAGSAVAEPYGLGAMVDGVAGGQSAFLHPAAEICVTNIGGEPVCHQVPDPPQLQQQPAPAPAPAPPSGPAVANRVDVPYLPGYVVVPHGGALTANGAAIANFWLQDSVRIDIRSTQTGQTYAWAYTGSGRVGVGPVPNGGDDRDFTLHGLDTQWCQHLGCLSQTLNGVSGHVDRNGPLACCTGGPPPEWSTTYRWLTEIAVRGLIPHTVSTFQYSVGQAAFTTNYPIPIDNHVLQVQGTIVGTATNLPRPNLVIRMDISANWGAITGSGAAIVDLATGQTLVENFDARGTFQAGSSGETWSMSLVGWSSAQF